MSIARDELRVVHLAVVALAVVLHDELPVGGHVVDDRVRHLGVLHPELRAVGSDVAERLGDRGGGLVAERHVDQPLPLLDPGRLQAPAGAVEVGGHARRRRQAPVEAVAPAVVLADEVLLDLPAGIRADACAAVPADIVQRVQAAVRAADDDHVRRPELDREVAAGLGQLRDVACVEPGAQVDALDVLSEDLVRRVVLLRKGHSALVVMGRCRAHERSL